MSQNEIAISVKGSLIGRNLVMARRRWYTRAVYSGPDMDCGDCRTVSKIIGWCNCSCLSDSLTSVNQPGVCTDKLDACWCSRLCRESACHGDSGDHPGPSFKPAFRE